MTSFGTRKLNLEFHPNLKKIFRYNVYDPSRMTPKEKGYNNSCVVTSIIIQLEYIATGSLRHLNKKKMRMLLHHLDTGTINFDDGITLKQFTDIENDDNLFKKLKNLYPFLKNKKGLCLCLYACQHSSSTNAYHLLPIRLGTTWNSSLHVNIDLLQDSKDIRPSCKNNKKRPTYQEKHVILILNFLRLHQSFRNQTSTGLITYHNLRNIEICRSCGKIFYGADKCFFTSHTKECQSFNATTNILGRRFVKNVVMFKGKYYCKLSKKFKTRYLKLERKQLNSLVRPMILICSDFESKNIKHNHDDVITPSRDSHHKPPKSTKFIQTPLAYSICIDSPYDYWRPKLPTELKKVEMKIFDEDSYTEEQFYLHYLKTLREKLIHIDQFLSTVKSLDPGPPKISECSIADRMERALAFRCFTCGSIFTNNTASKQTSKHHHSIHHNHYQPFGLGRFGNGKVINICQLCNKVQ